MKRKSDWFNHVSKVTSFKDNLYIFPYNEIQREEKILICTQFDI